MHVLLLHDSVPSDFDSFPYKLQASHQTHHIFGSCINILQDKHIPITLGIKHEKCH